MSEETKAWRCGVCGYVVRQAVAPEACPVCGAERSSFEPFTEDPAPTTAGAAEVAGVSAESSIVIVGVGIAGLSAADAVRSASIGAKITLVAKEPELPYYRLNLTRLLAGEVDEAHLPIHPESWYRDRTIQLERGREIVEIRPDDHRALLQGGDAMPYDKLILTVGSNPFLPPFPGVSREGVMTLRTLRDVQTILQTLRPGCRCVCIGGGFLGLEAAGGLARRGAAVTLLEGSGWLLSRQLNERAGKLLGARVEAMGIHLLTGAQTAEISGDGRAHGVMLKDGRTVPADLVLITTGVRPNSQLARSAGLVVNQGIVVDNHLVTSHPDILAAGDVAEHHGVLYGIWAPSQYQGQIAGGNAVGLNVEFGGLPRSNTLKVLGIDLVSVGVVEPTDAACTIIEEEYDDRYLRFVFRDARLVGAILLGDTAVSAAVNQMVAQGTDCSALLQRCPSARQVAEHFQL